MFQVFTKLETELHASCLFFELLILKNCRMYCTHLHICDWHSI